MLFCMTKESISLSHVFLTTMCLVVLVATSSGNFVTDKVNIECGDDPVTSIVNVTYFGEADCAFPVKDGEVFESCDSEYRPDGTLVLVDVNHRNCTFTRVGKTEAWIIRIKVQRTNFMMTSLDKEFAFTCVYDDIGVAEAP